MKNKYVYIAGPYTHPDPVENTHKVIQVADYLMQFGFSPYVPHMNIIWHLVIPHDPDFWYKYDLEWLKKCDCLLRLSGKSLGADEEVKFAKELGIPVYYTTDELLWFSGANS